MNQHPISLSELESHLREYANILRGPVDAADYKICVFPLLFAREFKTGRAQNESLPQHIECIYGWVRHYANVECIARVVTLDVIAVNDHNLDIPRYVEPKIDQEVLSVDEAMKLLRESAQSAFATEDRHIAILKREGLLV